MHRSIAKSTVISVAAHVALLIGLVGLRFETSEKPALGMLEVAWVVVDERIDSGSGPPAAGSGGSIIAAAEPEATAATSPDPASSAAPPRPTRAASRAPGREAARSEPLRNPAPVEPVPRAPLPEAVTSAAPSAPPALSEPRALSEPLESPDRPELREPPTAVTSSTAAPSGAAESAPPVQAAIDAPAPRSATATTSPSALRSPPAAEALAASEPPRNASSGEAETIAPSAPPPLSHPLAVEIETLTRDADTFSQPGPVVFEHDGRDYAASFRTLPAANDMALDELIVAVSTEQEGDRRTTEMRFKRLAFSHFAQFVDRWDPAVQIHDDEIDGRFHSNSELFIDASRGVQPTFHGKVTTARGISTKSATGRFKRRDVFLGGLETRVGKIVLKRDEAMFPSREASHGRSQRFDEDVRITFYADGTYGWQPADSSASSASSGSERRRSISNETFYLLGYDAKLFVRGTVNGRVLVHSNESIVIEGDLTYAASPDLHPGADDYLGLVSEKNIEVADPDVTGPGDLEVHGSIYAKRRFVIQRYRARELATLSILGSLTAGSLTASEPRYRTRVRFDHRLERVRPPGFPVTDRYELAAWDGRWEVE